MSKYDALWAYIQGRSEEKLILSFAEVERIAGTPLDHSFLKYKKGACAIRLHGRKNQYEVANDFVYQKGK